MTTRKRKTISEYIADRIIRNHMRVKFSTAHADFLEEQYLMSDTTQNSEVRPVVVKQVDHLAIEGSNKGDHRAQADDVQFPAQPGPRAETTNDENAGA